jgi:hypothetical protein
MKADRARLAAALRAEAHGTDLQLSETGLRVLVCGELPDGSLRELGSVDLACSLQVGAPSLRQMVDRVRFGGHR